MTEQSMPCPDCGNPIPFDVQALLSGAKLSCSGCHAQISISTDSMDAAKNYIDTFDKLKNNK